jgi:trans-aconitate methyltransferase
MPDGDYSSRPSSARIYDALLGGNHNFAADREAAKKLLEAIPYAAELARANRAFLNRAVNFMIDAGVRQFLDIGSGIPTVGNVHEIAQARVPDAKVVYVDIDPVAVAHSSEILRDNRNAVAVQADLRFPDAVLDSPVVRDLLDPDRPIGLLLVSVLHFVTDEAAFPAVDRIRAALPPGSFLAVSHGVLDTPADEAAGDVATIYRRTDVATAAGRTREQIMRFFGDADLVPPGLVWVHQWPDGAGDAQNAAVVAGVAKLP